MRANCFKILKICIDHREIIQRRQTFEMRLFVAQNYSRLGIQNVMIIQSARANADWICTRFLLVSTIDTRRKHGNWKQQNNKRGNEHKITNNDRTWRVQENDKAK